MKELFGSFLHPDEMALARQYMQDGYVIRDVEDTGSLDHLEDIIRTSVCSHLDTPSSRSGPDLLWRIHEYVTPDRLNDLRLRVIHDLNDAEHSLQSFYKCAASCLSTIVGNELAAQRSFALSIQMPDDDSSLLPAHSDVWSEDSPFEVVLWLPFVDCTGTMSMFLLPPSQTAWAHEQMVALQNEGVESFYGKISDLVVRPEVRRGQFMIFNHSLVHGNRVNVEGASRWSLNGRFKSLFSPYAEKRLGDYFVPITTRPATRLGMSYRLPDGFDE